jgi:DNA topoisomerase-1
METFLGSFLKTFSSDLKKAEEKSKEDKEKYVEQTDIICDKCGAKMIVKSGRFGKFAACPNYPKCKNTVKLDKNGKPAAVKERPEPEKTDMVCEKCGAPMVIRTSRYGKFYSCSNFPRCKNTKPLESAAQAFCPECGKPIAKKFSKKGSFYACTGYPACSFSTSNTPVDQVCPECGKTMFEKKSGARVCMNKNCPSNVKK